MILKNYFSVQNLAFAGIGIDPMVTNPKLLVKRSFLLFLLIFSACLHFTIVLHYIWRHISDFVEVTDSMPMLCQLILSLWKIAIFLNKRQEILTLISKIHLSNLKAEKEELAIVRKENSKDFKLCSLYLRIVTFSGSSAISHPVVYALYIYLSQGELFLIPPNKASYFWNYSHLPGYLVVYVLNVLTVYFVCVVSLAIDSLFSWFVSNITAQFHIIGHRFDEVAKRYNTINRSSRDEQDFVKGIKSCIQYHHQTLHLAETLNQVYGEIIFIKFIVVCSEIGSLVFRASRPNDSVADVAYKCLFLSAVALQLVLYCYNGQRIKDESSYVTTSIYFAFDWSKLSKSHKRLLFVPMLRSQRLSNIKGVFFEVDLSLYLWVFKTAASLITALKTLDENKI